MCLNLWMAIFYTYIQSLNFDKLMNDLRDFVWRSLFRTTGLSTHGRLYLIEVTNLMHVQDQPAHTYIAIIPEATLH